MDGVREGIETSWNYWMKLFVINKPYATAVLLLEITSLLKAPGMKKQKVE